MSMAALVLATALAAELQGSRDSDGLRIDTAGAGAYLRYVREGDATGVVAERASYRQGDWQRRRETLRLVHRDTDRRTAEGLRLSLTLSHQGGRDLAGGDVDWSRELRPGTRVGVVLARDWVETREALDAGVHADLAGASVDQAVGAFTLVGFAAAQRFSDGNRRDHLRARLIASVDADAGLTAQLRYRGFASRDVDVPRRYFNPPRYDQGLAVLALRRRFEPGVSLLAEAGYGRQRIAGEGSSPTWLVRAALGRVFANGAALRVDLLRTRAAGLAGPGYRYGSFAVSGEWPLP